MIKCAWINILETSAVSLAAGTEDPAYPLYRLYDRGAGRAFRPAGAGTVSITVDQGGEALPADRLLIPAGHNLEGMALLLEHSDDGAAYSPALEGWTAGAGLIERSWAPVSKRFWRLTIEPGPAVPEMAELFLTSTYEWERNPARPSGPFEDVHNVEHSQTAGGSDRFLIHGGPRRRRAYHMPRCGKAQKENIVALYEAYGGARPFWLCDHEGAWIYGRLRGPLNLRETAHGAWSFDFDFEEVLP